MVDFGVLSAVRQIICENGIGLLQGLSESSVYISVPDCVPQTWPMIFIELEETWSPNRKLKNAPQAKVAFRVSILCNNNDGSAAIEISNQINAAIDGLTLYLDKENVAVLKFKSSIVDFKKVLKQPRKVEQFYEAIVRDARSVMSTEA
ncbi:MAG: hypothetical protein LBF84_03055 [Holosporales bacterium]|jgi:hypothetical protein|nr:hypothetical protein [Holosporales bacterium]